MRKFHALTLAAMIACAACSQGGDPALAATDTAAQQSAAPTSEAGLAVIPVKVTTARHALKFKAEVAATEEQQSKGLMFRTSLGPNEAMLFPFAYPRFADFWMHNTVIPLDIIFIGPDHKILNVIANAKPYDETPLPSRGAAIAAFEIAGGRAAQLGIAAGDLVEW